MVEYRLVDFRTPRLGGTEDRSDLEKFERELQEEAAQGWRVHQVIGGLDDERLLFLFERPLEED